MFERGGCIGFSLQVEVDDVEKKVNLEKMGIFILIKGELRSFLKNYKSTWINFLFCCKT